MSGYCLGCASETEGAPRECDNCRDKGGVRFTLAERLYWVREGFWGPARQSLRFDAVSPHVVGEYLVLADECLRQMEWARRDATEHILNDNEASQVLSEFAPLSLPPDGWTP